MNRVIEVCSLRVCDTKCRRAQGEIAISGTRAPSSWNRASAGRARQASSGGGT
jgi:hypothetical protein